MKKIFSILFCMALTANVAFAGDVWINDLRTKFINNSAIMLEINPRTFGAVDSDGDGLINKKEGEESGNFLNSMKYLEGLNTLGVNTIVLMPINQIGKIKALGTAGSLYAISDFGKINHQLVSDKTIMSDIDQAKKFINEAHSKDLRVVVDLPAFGAYDLYLKRPELFAKGQNGEPIVPGIYTDVRMFDTGNDYSYNKDVYAAFQEFVDLMQELDVDGIRACCPYIQNAKFWKDLIIYSRRENPQMLWLAQTYDRKDDNLKLTVKTSNDELLAAGFDGYFSSFDTLNNDITAKAFDNQLRSVINFSKKTTEKKALVSAFATHDDISPMLGKGVPYITMQYWLNATLPVNSYTLDGVFSGDNFIYKWGNKKATVSDTDDFQYFVNRGKMDIFNYSRKPVGPNGNLVEEFVMANRFKRYFANHLNLGNFRMIGTNNTNVFAYASSYNRTTILVMGNTNFTNYAKADIKLPKFKEDENLVIPVRIKEAPIIEKNKISITLDPGELQLLVINDYNL